MSKYLDPEIITRFDKLIADTRQALAITDHDSVEYALLAMTDGVEPSVLRCLVAYLTMRVVTEVPA